MPANAHDAARFAADARAARTLAVDDGDLPYLAEISHVLDLYWTERGRELAQDEADAEFTRRRRGLGVLALILIVAATLIVGAFGVAVAALVSMVGWFGALLLFLFALLLGAVMG